MDNIKIQNIKAELKQNLQELKESHILMNLPGHSYTNQDQETIKPHLNSVNMMVKSITDQKLADLRNDDFNNDPLFTQNSNDLNSSETLLHAKSGN